MRILASNPCRLAPVPPLVGAALVAALVVALFLGALPGRAGMGAHGIQLPEERSLRERILEADAGAVGTIGQVGLGRIEVIDAVPLFSKLDPTATRFELKRAPSNPPPLARGARVVLLLRGARDPYLLTDSGDEIVQLEGPEDERLWVEAIREVFGALDAGDALLSLYRGWIRGGSGALWREGVIGLGDREAPFQPISRADESRLIALAGSAEADIDLRQLAARVVSRTGSGREALLASLPGAGASADPALVTEGIRIALTVRDPALRDLLARSFEHPDAGIRLAALRMGATVAADPELRPVLERLAASDPDPDVRAAASRSIERRTNPHAAR